MKIKITVDRIEDEVLVCFGPDGTLYEVKREDAPDDICEGDICTACLSEVGRLTLLQKNKQETENKKAESSF